MDIPGWDDELIRDFGKSMPEDDTLIEGVARAYSSYSLTIRGD